MSRDSRNGIVAPTVVALICSCWPYRNDRNMISVTAPIDSRSLLPHAATAASAASSATYEMLV